MATGNDVNQTIPIDLNPSGVNDVSTPGMISIDQNPVAPEPQLAAPQNIPNQQTPRNIPKTADKPPIISPTQTVPMFSPNGDLGDIPTERVHDAIKAGGIIGTPVVAPDGSHGVVPASRLHEALKAGGKIDPDGWAPMHHTPGILEKVTGLPITATGPGTIGADVTNRWNAATPKNPDLNAPYQSTGQLPAPSVITPPEAHEELSKGVVANAMTPYERQQHPFLAAGLDFAGGMTSPENFAIMVGSGGLGKLPGPAGQIIAKALSSGFGLMSVYAAVKESPQFMDALAKGDEPGAKEALMKIVLNIAAGEMAAEHVIPGFKPTLGAVGESAEAGTQALGAAATEYGGKAVDAVKKAGEVAGAVGGVVKGAGQKAAETVTQPVKMMNEGSEERLIRSMSGSAGVNERDLKENATRMLPYLVEQNKTSKVSTPEDLAEAMHDQKTKLWNDKLGGKHPGETIDGDKIAQDIKDGINTSTRRHFPEVTEALEKWADTFKGPYQLDEAMQAITDFNSKLRNFYKQSPSEQYRMAAADPKLGILQDAADSLRDHAFDKLSELGEKNIPELRKDYGALNQWQRVAEKRAVVYGRQAPVDFKQSMGAVAAVASGHPLAAAIPFVTKYLNSPEHLIESAIKKASKTTTATPPETPTEQPNPTKATAGPGLGSKIDLPAYNLPTEPAQNVPADRRAEGTLPADVHKHEWGHITNAAIEDFGTEGIKSDSHPDLAGQKKTAAATIIFHGVDFDDPESVARNSGRILSTILGGAAADELHSQIPFEINRMAGGDVKLLKDIFKKVGFSDDEIDGAIRYGLDRAKRNLTKPGIGDILQANAKVREADLHPDYHASPERTEAYANEVRRIRDENNRAGKTAVQGNDEANAGEPGNKSPKVDAGTEGEISGEGTKRSLPATAVVTPDEEESKEPVTARDAFENIKKKYGESSNAAKTGEGASFITPEGKFVHLGTDDHPQVIKKAGYESDSQDTRVPFINESGAIRSNFTTGRAGRTLSFSVPKDGVNPEQIDAMKAAVHQGLGRNGQLRIETADSPTNLKNSIKDFATANNVEPMLREIGVHPEQSKKLDLHAEKEEYKESPGWTEKAIRMAKDQGGAFSIDTKSGEAPKTGYMVEARPESRIYLNHEATPEDLQKFHDDNREYLAEHPDLHVGGWYDADKGKNELNISARTEDKNRAIDLAKKLDQVAIYDLNKGEPIETGGKSEQIEFPDYPLNQRMANLRGESKPYDEKTSQRISSRFPTAVSASEDPMGHNLTLDVNKILERPKVAQALSEKILKQNKSMVFTPEEKANPKDLFDSFIRQAKDNIKYVYNQARASGNHIADRIWYDGAHNFGTRDAEVYGLEPRQNFATIATQSPQKDWNQNVSLYERLTDAVLNKPDVKFTPEMNTKANQFIREIAKTNSKRAAQGKSQIDPWVDRKLINKLKGKSLDDLSNPVEKAAWVRLYDEAHNPREFHEIAPDGTKKGIVMLKGTNTPEKVAWGGLDSIAKGISVLQDGSLENISRNLGEAHKVRSFYNNIAEPNSPHEDVTADTHHVGLSLMRPVAGSDAEPALNFGGNGSTITGTHGTYPLYVEATRQAMRELNAEHPDDPPMQYPRQLQSVAWVEWRKMFPPESRTEATKNSVNSIWKEHLDGKITADEARQQVSEFARRLRSGLDEGEQRPADEGKLPAHQLHGAGSSTGSGTGSSAGTEVPARAVKINPKKQAAANGWLGMMQSTKTGQKSLGTK